MKLGKTLHDWHIKDKNTEKCADVINSFYCVFLSHAQDVREHFYNFPQNILIDTDSELYFFQTYMYIFVPDRDKTNTGAVSTEHCIIKIIPALEHFEYQVFRDHKKLFSINFDKKERVDQQVLDMKWCEAAIKNVIQKCSVSNSLGFSSNK